MSFEPKEEVQSDHHQPYRYGTRGTPHAVLRQTWDGAAATPTPTTASYGGAILKNKIIDKLLDPNEQTGSLIMGDANQNRIIYGRNGVGTCLFDALGDPRVAQRVTMSSITLQCEFLYGNEPFTVSKTLLNNMENLKYVRNKLRTSMHDKESVHKMMLPSKARTLNDLYEFYDDEQSADIIDEIASVSSIREVCSKSTFSGSFELIYNYVLA